MEMSHNELEDTFELNILSKVKLYFETNVCLSYQKLDDFLFAVDLADVFYEEDDKIKVWEFFVNQSQSETVDLKSCEKGMMDVFKHYAGANSSDANDFRTSIRESMRNKSMDNSLKLFTENKNDNSAINKHNKSQDKSYRKILSNFSEDQLQEMGRAISLLEIKNKSSVTFDEIKEKFSKYKLISITLDDIEAFVGALSIGETSDTKFNINKDLAKQVLSYLDNEISQFDSGEINENYNIHNYLELIDNLNKYNNQTADYSSVISDSLKSIIITIEDIINENQEIKQNLMESLETIKNKLDESVAFTTKIKSTTNSKSKGLNTIFTMISDLNRSHTLLREEIESLHKKKFENVKEEFDEKFAIEIELLEHYKSSNESEIKNLKFDLDKKDLEIENLRYDILNYKNNHIKFESKIHSLENQNKKLEEQYRGLIDRINETEDTKNTESKQNFETNLSKDPDIQYEKEYLKKIRLKLSKKEETKKLAEMNFEQLVEYTKTLDIRIKELEELISTKEKHFREELSKQINLVNSLDTERKKLKQENISFREKLDDMKKEIELNSMFRPSKVLTGRISRISRLGEATRFGDNSRHAEPLKLVEKGTNFNLDSKTNNILFTKNSSEEDFSLNEKQRSPLPTNKFAKLVEAFKENIENIEIAPYDKTNENYHVISRLKSDNDYEINENTQHLINGDKTYYEQTNTNMDIFGKEDKLGSSNEYLFDKNPTPYRESINQTIINIDDPFEDKSNDNFNNPFSNEKEKSSTSIDLNKVALFSSTDLDVKEIQVQREKEKHRSQKKLMKGSHKKMPSSITEEMQDDENNAMEIEMNRLSTHNKEDIPIESAFNKESQNMIYDFLNIRKTNAIVVLLENNSESCSSYDVFSDNIYLIETNDKRTKRVLFITPNSILVLRPYDLTLKLEYSLKDLRRFTIANKNCNLLVLHFKHRDSLVIEVLRRMELLYYFRDLCLGKKLGKLMIRYSDNFTIIRNGIENTMHVEEKKNFITNNFQDAKKMGFLSKLSGRFFSGWVEKLLVLTDVGLLYFDDPNNQPKRLIDVIGSKITKNEKYKGKFCFEITTLKGESFIFATTSQEDLDSWIKEFQDFKSNYQKKIRNIDKVEK